MLWFLWTLLISAGVANAVKPRTTLDDQFCQIYYTLNDSNCESIRSSVRSELRGSGTPTLELGDPALKPVMLFFHGFPDTNAIWANQFAAFCGDGGEYACVAPSMMNHNPDVAPEDNQSKLSWPLQADVLHEVVTELGLKNITLVVHDFGSLVGSMYISRYPDTVKRAIIMDIANNPGAPPPPGPEAEKTQFAVQKMMVAAYLGKNDTQMVGIVAMFRLAFQGLGAPCEYCKVAPETEVGVGYRTAWMHYTTVNNNTPWTNYFDTPIEEWKFVYTPTWPDHVPQLFLWSTASFHTPELLTWLDGRGDGSGHKQFDKDHWFFARTYANETNQAISEFIVATDRIAVNGPGAPGAPGPSAKAPGPSDANGVRVPGPSMLMIFTTLICVLLMGKFYA